jgi:ELWxxDGT repeat protein
VYTLAEAVERRVLLSSVEPVADLDPRTASSMTEDPNNRSQIVVGRDGLAIFTAAPAAGQLGFQPWRSDGTPKGTYQLGDMRIGEGGQSQDRLAAGPDGTVFFRGYTPQAGAELWKTDGTVAGTTLVRDIVPGTGSGLSNALPMGTFAGADGRSRVVFNASDPQFGQRVWVSDGTEAGTQPVFTPQLTWVTDFTGSGNQAFFIGTDTTAGAELWRTDGTAAGTYLVREIRPGPQPGYIRNLTASPGGLAYFIAVDDSFNAALWRSDGTEAGTYRVARAQGNVDQFDMQKFAVAGDTLYFFMDGDLWKTHGQPLDATLVKEVPAGPADGITAVVGSTVYFLGGVSTFQAVLWKSDGTAAGTGPVLPRDTIQFPLPTELVGFNGRVYFRATRYGLGSADVELWSSDGTAGGTRPVKDIAAGERFSSNPFLLTPAGDRMFFVADDVEFSGFEPWVTDGSEAGTRLLRDINRSPYGSGPTRLTRVGDKVFLFTPDAPHGGVWVTDGSAAGTRLLRSDLFPADPFLPGRNLVADVNGTFFFVAFASGERPVLWKSDGTPEGTVRVGGDLYNVSRLTPAGNRLFFTAIDPGGAYSELWDIDRAGGPPRPLVDRPEAILRTDVLWMTPVGDVVYFPAMTPDHGEELWRSDGTRAGTYEVTDLRPVPNASSQPRALADVGGTLMFIAMDPDGLGLYRSGGAAATTTLVKRLDDRNADLYAWYNSAVSGGVMYFGAPYGGVWRSDGTAGGTFLIKDDGEFGTAPTTAPGGYAVARDGRVYFTSSAPFGIGVWVSDGTRAGTRELLQPHANGAPPHDFAASPAGGVYFNASDVGNYFFSRLWQSDGTPQGTRPVGWDTPDAPGRPADLVPLGDAVLFAGTEAAVGRELFKLVGGTASGSVVGRHAFYNLSAFDGNDAAPNVGDDNAIASDKAALLPGQGGGGFANVTSYGRGINGVMIDVSGALPLTALAGIGGGVGLKVGTGGDPAGWVDAPRPSQLTIRRGAGLGGSDRITFTWPDGAIRNSWLRVTVNAVPQSGLDRTDVFYFGNLVGETGDGASLSVGAGDLVAVRASSGLRQGLAGRHDHHRDGRVNAADRSLARGNLTRRLSHITGGAAPVAAAAVPDARRASGARSRYTGVTEILRHAATD